MIIRDYELDGQPLGKGGMGTVYKARHTHLQVDRAIKVIIPETGEIDQKRKRFLVEARTQFDLKHPNIVEVYDCFEENSRFYIVMEYVQGDTLKTLIEKRYGLKSSHSAEPGHLKPADVFFASDAAGITIISRCLDALQHAHSHNVIHRDIKPANIMVNFDGEGQPIVKLTDFGIAKINVETADESLTKTGMTLGTVHYMAPEQLETNEPGSIDHRADLYALGITMFEMLTGELPFGGRSTSIMKIMYNKLQNSPPNLLAYKDTINPLFYAIIEKAIKRDRNERFQSAEDFKKALTTSVTQGKEASEALEASPGKVLPPAKTNEAPDKALHEALIETETPGMGTIQKTVVLPAFQRGGDNDTATQADWKAPHAPQEPHTKLPQRNLVKLVTASVLALLAISVILAVTLQSRHTKVTPLPSARNAENQTGEVNEALNEAAFVNHLKEIRATYRRLRLRAVVRKLDPGLYGDEERQAAWQWLKDKPVTLFGVPVKIEKQGDFYDITVHNPRVAGDGFNMRVKAPQGAGTKEPLLGHIMIFEGTITDYIPPSGPSPVVLSISGAKILEVLQREQFRLLKERLNVSP